MAASIDPRLAIERIGQVSIPVKDIARATAFYRDALGLRLTIEVPGLAFFDCGGTRLMLSTPEKPEFDHPASILYYQVSDIDTGYSALAARGVSIISPPTMIADMGAYELWMCFCRDSEGNVLSLMSEKQKA